MNEINEALGTPRAMTFRGKTWRVEPLDMVDLGEIQSRLGSLNALSTRDPRLQFEILYLALRKADPDLTDDEREDERYRLTRTAVRRMVSLPELEKPETQAFLGEIVARSGLFGDPDAPDAPDGTPDGTDDGPKNGETAGAEVTPGEPPDAAPAPRRSTRRSAG